ncbi:hypothetical protein BDK51DRAFT_50729 [Blyttiomyces helicus]|uniref:Serine-tRNA synthetase type1 N-terminal domain-containing protein n=1 Tax=Blyttiomyces helicus TaxID=388810 RepID=A0A4P9W4N9_9FUNG|nr:hypothetical protein BDK51DRAFT_50729 [Blyttiomyces helicus]|eukprot:RKO87321.1 hypothetical protein BDK51DRAFT_50729 [Blyttiomyces helicus]
MGIDINLLRIDRGGNPDLVCESQRKRGGPEKVALVDQVLAIDDAWKKARFDADAGNRKINEVGEEIKEIKDLAKSTQQGTHPAWVALQSRKAEAEAEKAALDRVADGKEKEERKAGADWLWWPLGRTEAAEKERREAKVGKEEGKGVLGLYSHHEVLERISGYDSARGTNVAGHRGYFLSGPGVDFNLALIQYGLNFLEKRGYTKLWTPFFMRRDLMAKTAQLEEFDEALYKLGDVEGENGEDDSKCLIATSEQPISAFHAGEWFAEPEKELPKKCVCWSLIGIRQNGGGRVRDWVIGQKVGGKC